MVVIPPVVGSAVVGSMVVGSSVVGSTVVEVGGSEVAVAPSPVLGLVVVPAPLVSASPVVSVSEPADSVVVPPPLHAEMSRTRARGRERGE